MKAPYRLAVALLAGVAALALPAAAQDVKSGYVVAQRFCAGCHEIERGRFRNEMSVSFAAIASRPITTISGLEALLRNPHHSTLDYLSLQEMEDVSAYVFSLK